VGKSTLMTTVVKTNPETVAQARASISIMMEMEASLLVGNILLISIAYHILFYHNSNLQS